ncbi:F-box/kelch-repeat protein At3g06240-like [Prosopis cineraria]|uniref:F-box/kelch-repeat protein At3g06240-like n=1 Tax=Prosopis cineraria TaxID=364024 RepID=UPI00240EA108|nr:F-box/kelch-repeat protein At3g06240-like [Prosopis cineraria]
MVRELNSNLPQELLEDILSRLPYKSLLRFKCVCKFWYALFTDPIFQALHVSHFIKHHTFGNSVILRLSFPTTSYGLPMQNYKLFSLSSNDSSVDDTLLPEVKLLSTKFRISGHCNGILCLSGGYWSQCNEVILYNPATREFKCLPDSNMRSKSSFALAVGLGYNSQTDDYKVVRIWTVDTGVYTTNRVEMYSLSTDSWARLYNSNTRDFDFEDDCFALFFKGTYYWWGFKRGDKSTIILGLKMGDEVFHRVSAPDNVDIRKPDRRSLAVWKESISLICCSGSGLNMSIDIWVMKGFGAQGSWTKMQSIMNLLEEPKPLVFWKEDELLLETCGGEIKSYNVVTQKIKNLKIEGNPVLNSAQAVNYVATLVSIKGGSCLA